MRKLDIKRKKQQVLKKRKKKQRGLLARKERTINFHEIKKSRSNKKYKDGEIIFKNTNEIEKENFTEKKYFFYTLLSINNK